ncbi:hypothetical protein GDO86_014751 [Hymenochirus boettgeri]|uniref:Uncharacterized protein n=1 Tax=Hymenochirus boettgeri TaxID=247094 RepID=A0A8T2JV78_9PIPI|nr:hypothetical protein GDO86_014751 [Hymenochirus boettgeri]
MGSLTWDTHQVPRMGQLGCGWTQQVNREDDVVLWAWWELGYGGLGSRDVGLTAWFPPAEFGAFHPDFLQVAHPWWKLRHQVHVRGKFWDPSRWDGDH